MADVVVLVYPRPGGAVRWETHKRIARSSFLLRQSAEGPFEWVAEEDAHAERTPDRVLACIDAGSTDVDEIAETIGKKRSAVYAALGELRKAGLVASGTPLRRTPE